MIPSGWLLVAFLAGWYVGWVRAKDKIRRQHALISRLLSLAGTPDSDDARRSP